MRKVSLLIGLLLLALAAFSWQHAEVGKQAAITVALGGFIDPDGR